MDELAFMNALVRQVLQEMTGFEVRVVRLDLGQPAATAADALHSCFDASTRGTFLDGAKLEIASRHGRAELEPLLPLPDTRP